MEPEQEKTPKERIQEDADRIRELRERLYARGGETVGRHTIPTKNAIYDTLPTAVPTPKPPSPAHPHIAATPLLPPIAPKDEDNDMKKSSRTSYRTRLIIGSIVFFLLALVVSAGLLFFGGNSISGENISITLSGPLQVGGGEELPFTVAIANQNSVPIKSATLIIEYPRGTQSVGDAPKEVTIERRALDSIAAGELVNVQLSARVFGEENAEQEIKARIEYRVDGSNATFERKAEPLHFKIGTSPVVLTFGTVDAVSSGQEIELALTVQSNAPAPLENLLVKVAYPSGFDFTAANPDVVSGEDTWRIKSIQPGEKQVIKVRGVVTGLETETRQFTATAGIAADNGATEFASQLAAARTDVAIEKAFLSLDMSINGNADDTVIVGKGEPATVDVVFKNSLDATVYDGEIVLTLTGNALNKFSVNPHGGFYNSSDHTITWVGSEEHSLAEMVPGSTNTFTVVIYPEGDVGTGAELALSVAAQASRVSESRPTEALKGVAERTIRIESIPTLGGGAYHGSGPFTNSGPVPPVVDLTTQYTLTLRAAAGANDLAGAEVTATMPQFVNWLDLTQGDGSVAYNATTRTLKWTIGDIDGGKDAEMSVQVSVKPSTSQIGQTLTLLDTQRLKATDGFTGTVVRAESPAFTTRVVDANSDEEADGRVRRSED